MLAEEWGVDGGEEGAGAQVAEKVCGADGEPLSGDVIILLLPVADSVSAAVLIAPAGGFRDEDRSVLGGDLVVEGAGAGRGEGSVIEQGAERAVGEAQSIFGAFFQVILRGGDA